jgi:NAD(P)-dependent dehydrogenase (short-subunit alcohol dehydrogenase family)
MVNQMDLMNKVALVTGGGSGIGRATAICFANAGARVAVMARSEDELREVAEKIRAAGREALELDADVSDPTAVHSAVERVIGRWGKLDIVIANAGINGVWAPIEDLEPDEWDETVKVNLRGSFLTLKYAIPHMKARGGSMVITSSVNGTRTFSTAGATAYSCTKAAQVALAKMAALELAKHRIRVNVVCPGAIDTPILQKGEQRNLDQAREPVEYPEGGVPLTDGRPGTAEQVAQLMLFLASDLSSHITGTEIWIDGGESFLHG